MVALSGNGWVLSPCLVTLVQQFDAQWPTRDHSSDGSIGDVAHQHEQSDHNPSDGFVDALDVDTDLTSTDPGVGGAMAKVVEKMRLSRDTRINYLIFNGQMVRSYDKPGIPAWDYATYTGSDPHTSHLHISIKKTAAARQDTRPWAIDHSEASHAPDLGDDDMPKLFVLADSVNYGGVQYNKGDVYVIWDGKRHLLAPGPEYNGHVAQWGAAVAVNATAWGWLVDNTALDEAGERSIPPAQFKQLLDAVAAVKG